MAIMTKELKKTLSDRVKAVLGSDWKVSFSVRHNSSIVMTVQSSPFDFFDFIPSKKEYEEEYDGVFHEEILSKNVKFIENKTLQEIMSKVFDAINSENNPSTDRDAYRDVFDVNYYSHVFLGGSKKSYHSC